MHPTGSEQPLPTDQNATNEENQQNKDGEGENNQVGGEKNDENQNEANKPLNDECGNADMSAPNTNGENALNGNNGAPKGLQINKEPLLSSPTLRKRKTHNYHKMNTGAPDSDEEDSNEELELAQLA